MENLFFKIVNGVISYDGHLKYEDDEYIIVAEGDICLSNISISLLQVVEHLRAKKDIADIDGLYSMIIFNKNTGKLVAIQDIFSYIHPLYYAVVDEGICVALYLRQVIVETGIHAKLEKDNIAEFLYNGFLTDDRCLISRIKKVPAMHVMIYDLDSKNVRYVKRTYSIHRKPKDESDYSKILEKNLYEAIGENSQINMALSSGFDSNFILNSINRVKPESKINAYTIGAENGNDETQNVIKICSYHPEVTLTIEQVTPDALQSLPQIVYELEDSIFERGIFLQYIMSNLLFKSKISSLVLGEGADQILSSEFNTSAEPYYFVGIEEHYPWVYYPYEMLTYIILKKNGIFLRNRNIRAHYPFIKANFIRGVSEFRKLNGTSKEHYKAYIVNKTRNEVGELLIKRPGSTNLSTLFNKNNHNLLGVVKLSEYYHLLPKQPDRDSGTEVELDNCLKVLFVMAFEELFCNQSFEALKRNDVNVSLDKLLDKITQQKAGLV